MRWRRRFPIRSVDLAFAVALSFAVAANAAHARGADGEFEKRTSSHFVLYQDVDIHQTSGLRGSRRFEQQVLATLEKAYDRLDEYLGLRPGRPITVVIYDPRVFDAQFTNLFRFPSAGFYQGTVHVRGDTVVSDRLVRVLHHELVHAAFDAEAPSLVLPAWLNEGVAEWFDARSVGQRGLGRGQYATLVHAEQSGQTFALYDLAGGTFAGFGPDAARLAYAESHAFIDFLVRHYGDRALRDFCKDVMRVQDVDRSVKRVYRRSLDQLEADFRDDLRAGARL